MIDRQGKKIIIECDTCGATVDSNDNEEFREFWSQVKTEGWKAELVGKDWVHTCMDCRDE